MIGRIGAVVSIVGTTWRVDVEDDSYFVCECTGSLTLAISRNMQAALDRLAELHPHIDRVLYDRRSVDDVLPGLAIEWIRWSQRRARKSRRVAIVTPSYQLGGAGRVLRYLLPKLQFGVFSDRGAAIAFLLAGNDAR